MSCHSCLKQHAHCLVIDRHSQKEKVKEPKDYQCHAILYLYETLYPKC